MPRELTVASTTDSQEEVNSAAGLFETVVEEEEKEEQAAAEETASETESDEEESEESSESDEAGEEEKQETASGEKKPRKSGFQKRIDKLTRKNYELEESLEEQKRENQRLRAGGKSSEKVEATSTEDPRPDPSKYMDNPDKFIEDLADWKARQTVREMLANDRKESTEKVAKEQAQQVFNAYNKKVSEARGRYDDFDEVVGNDEIQIPQSVQLAVVEMENGPDVAYFLGKNPEICEALVSMSPIRAVAEIGVISRALSDESDSESGESAGKTEEKPAVKKLSSSAPKPITPIKGKSTKTSIPLDQLPFREYRRIRDEQEKRRYN